MKNINKKETDPIMAIRNHPLYEKIKDEVDGLMKLAIEVNVARTAQGLSQQALAKKVGTTQKEISKVESGDIDIRFNTLRKIAKTLGLNFLIGNSSINEGSLASKTGKCGLNVCRNDENGKNYSRFSKTHLEVQTH
jgi:transcriptional regulator with XRE-family HTH domain